MTCMINANRPARRAFTALLLSVSGMALASTPAIAQEVVFSDNGTRAVSVGQRMAQTNGVTQVRLPSGVMLSFVNAAQYTINADGSVSLHEGTVTVAGADGAPGVIRMPDGAQATVSGAGSAGSFTVSEDGQSTGQTLTGSVSVARGRSNRDFDAGEHWVSAGRQGLRQTVSNGAQATPSKEAARVAQLDVGGPVAAAQNGLPVSLGDALAAAGASADILGAARRVEAVAGNPDLATFPSGDLALLVAAAAQLEDFAGGAPFPQAQADIIRTYLGFLAGGGSGADFLTAYAGFVTQYLDLLRSGALPSEFSATGVADINAFLAYQARLGALGQLAVQDRVLVEAYLAFLAGGGNVDAFTAQFTNLVEAYFAFVRAGGNPADFTGASAELVDQYIAFLNDSGLLAQLSQANQALLAAYLANGGLGFAGEYTAALQAYFQFLTEGGLPSTYGELDQATLLAYLDALQEAGLLGLLDEQSQFFADYLAFVQGGGDPDLFTGLPALNLPAFADALNAYAAFLAGGGLPSEFADAELDVLANYLRALANAGELESLLGANTDLLNAYFAYLATGADADQFAGLPIYANYVLALQAYYDFLAGGGLPADYTALTQEQIEAYLAALAGVQGGFGAFGGLSSFFADYYAFIIGGGDPQEFAGLPVYLEYLAAIEAFYAYLLAGALPSAYTALTQEQIEAYLAALANAGVLSSVYSGDALVFFTSYLAHLAGGGVPDNFTGLPGGGSAGSTDLGFTLAAGARRYINSPASGSGLSSSPGGSVDAQGQPSGFSWQPANESALDVAGNADGVIGRFVSNNLHYAIINPVTGGLPTSGTIDYQMIAATSPTYSDNATAPGSFTANLTIGFGSSLSYGIDGAITMPDATYTFASPGRSSGQLAPVSAFNDLFLVLRPSLSQTGRACQSSDCYLNLAGYFGGDNGQTLGFTYRSAYSSDLGKPYLLGAVLFGASAASTPGSGNFDDAYNVYLLQAANLSVGTGSATVDNAGVIADQTYGTGNTLAPDSGAVLDVADRVDDTVAFTSYADTDSFYTNGTLLMLSGERAINLPASGTVFYRLLDGTAPMEQLAAAGSEGYFTNARLGVSFGTQTRVGINFDVFSGTRGWHAQTAGGSSTPSDGGLVLDAATGGFSGRLQTSGIAGDACLATCNTDVYGALFGNGGTLAGLTYLINDAQADQSLVQGIAVFGTSGTAVAGIGTDPRTSGGAGSSEGGDTSSNFTGTRDSIVYYTFLDGSLASGFGGSADLENGELTTFTSILGTIDHASADIVEAGDLGDVAWARWTNGTVESRTILGDADTVLDATDGYHVMAGNPTIDLPAGTIAYELIGGTSATDNRGSAPGTMTGDLAIDFATLGVGYDLHMEVGGMGWAVSTTGGAADPSSSQFAISVGSGGWTFGGTFASTTGTVNATGGACAGTCIVNVSGTLFGANADYAALAMNVTDASAQNGTIGASGLAIFGQEGAATINAPAADTGTWARWEAPAGGSNPPVAGADMMIAPGLDALAGAGIQYTPDQIARLEAHLQRQLN